MFSLLGLWLTFSRPSPDIFRRYNQGRFVAIVIIWVLAFVFALAQTLPLPAKLVATLSPSASDLYSWALPSGGDTFSRQPLSTTPGATVASGLMIGSCGAAFFLTARLCTTRKRMLWTAGIIILVGTGEALMGLVQSGERTARSVYGSFVNRNHYAAWLAVSWCLTVGLLLWTWESSASDSSPTNEADRTGQHLNRWTLASPLLIALLIIISGAIFSLSRMGVFAPALMTLMFGALWMLGPVPGRTRLIGAAGGAMVLLLMIGAGPMLDQLARRFETQHFADYQRTAAWEGTVRLFQSSPLVGVGLGGLTDNLPRTLPLPIEETFDHSHSDLLEILAEGGLLYAGLIITGIVLYYGILIPAWLRRNDPFARGIGAGCLAGSTALLLHSLVDFPLRMPANALTFSVVMGIGWASIHYRFDAKAQPAPVARYSVAIGLLRVAALMIAIAGAGMSALAGAADLLDQAGDRLVQHTLDSKDTVRPPLLDQASRLYQHAHRLQPWQPVHSYRIARSCEVRAHQEPALSTSAQALWVCAATWYKDAVRMHPANARIQTALSWAALQSGDLATGRQAVQAALRLAPNDPEVNFAIARWYLAQWQTLSPEDRLKATALVSRRAPERPDQYVEAVWQFVQDPRQVRAILPTDTPVRRALLSRLTERRLFEDRWAELAAHPELQATISSIGFTIISSGILSGRQTPPDNAVAWPPWTGMVSGWLSTGLMAEVNASLPPGEVVLYIPVRGESADEIWPIVNYLFGDRPFLLPQIQSSEWRTIYALITTGGAGALRLRATLANGTIIFKDGQFVERRATLGPIHILTPSAATLQASTQLSANNDNKEKIMH